MICKYCGREIKSSAGKLTYQGSPKCKSSASGRHVALPVPGTCVYCGRNVKTGSAGMLLYNGSPQCPSSPTNKHCLQD